MKAIKTFISGPIEYGTDKEHGGIFYFLDVDGTLKSTLQMFYRVVW
jgi:hypothetical protein